MEDFVPVAHGELMGGVSSLDAGTGDQDADVVTVSEDAFAEILNLFLTTEVRSVYESFSVKLFYQCLALDVSFVSLDGVRQSSRLQRRGRLTCTRMISAPASASDRAIACPMPLVPPVTTALRPFNENRDSKMLVMITSDQNNLRRCAERGSPKLQFFLIK